MLRIHPHGARSVLLSSPGSSHPSKIVDKSRLSSFSHREGAEFPQLGPESSADLIL